MRRLNIGKKMAVLPKVICSSVQSPSKFPPTAGSHTLTPKFMWKCKEVKIAKASTKKKTRAAGLPLSVYDKLQ